MDKNRSLKNTKQKLCISNEEDIKEIISLYKDLKEESDIDEDSGINENISEKKN